MYLLTPMIRGKAYEHADVAVIILGQQFTGVSSIDYDEDQDMQNEYAAGKEVVARSYGQIKPTAKITMLMGDIEAVQAISPTGRIQDVPEFTVVITFVDAAFKTVVHKLNNCRFKKNMRTSKSGDGAIFCDIDLIISHITWK
jgi:hypothetical protein